VSDRNRRPASGRQPTSKGGKSPAGGSASPKETGSANASGAARSSRPAGSHSASGTQRAWRRETERQRPPEPATPTLLDQLRKPFSVSFVIFAITAGSPLAVLQLASPINAPSATPAAPTSPAPSASGG